MKLRDYSIFIVMYAIIGFAFILGIVKIIDRDPAPNIVSGTTVLDALNTYLEKGVTIKVQTSKRNQYIEYSDKYRYIISDPMDLKYINPTGRYKEKESKVDGIIKTIIFTHTEGG